MAGLKLVSINIERSKHLDRVEKFLGAEDADVVCIQERCERDIPVIESITGSACSFAPMSRIPKDTPDGGFDISGIGIFSKNQISESRVEYYVGSESAARTSRGRAAERNRAVLIVGIETDGHMYQIITTHFSWTPDGRASDEQRQDMKALLDVLAPMKKFVLTGDFNAPREIDGEKGEIFAMLAEKYKDNIPAQYITSIDLDLHRAGKTRAFEVGFRMVDGLFTTPGYTANDVVLHTGVSDHCAIVAHIVKRG